MPIGLIAIAIAGLLIMGWRYRRDQMETRRKRQACFNDCSGLLENPHFDYDAFGYPVMTGRYRGHDIKAALVVDTLGVRKLPSLWLQVTVHAPVAVNSRFGVIMRPLGTEFFSTVNDLHTRIDLSPAWPPGAIGRASGEPDKPALDALSAHAGFCDHPRGKEIFVSPHGIRMIWQQDEAERGNYLMLRQATFSRGPVARAELRDILNQCLALRGDLDAAAGHLAGAA